MIFRKKHWDRLQIHTTCPVWLEPKFKHWTQTMLVNTINSHIKTNRRSHHSQLLPDQLASLTEGGASIGPGNRRHNNKTKALVLSTLDLHVVRLKGGRYHRAAAPASAAAAYAAGGSAAGTDCVEGVLAPLGGPLALRQARSLGAAVVGGGWRWRDVPFPLWHWRYRGKCAAF